MASITSAPPAPEPQVDADTRNKPKILFRLGDWQYLERSIHRLLAAWGRSFEEWDDKSALHRHVWDQAECVRRLRERIVEFVGGKPDAAVSARLEKLGNTVLLAPSFEDAVDGIYGVFTHALVKSYLDYVHRAHPVHDAPTLAMLHEICTIKEQHRLWYHDYRRRHPHTIDPAYAAAIDRELAECGHLERALPVEGNAARPVGAATDFRLPRFSARKSPWRPKYNLRPYIRADFHTSIETRRLFWAQGYMMEKNLPDDQLRWIYWAHEMPWEFHRDVSRHLWDESRHGDSGFSRLQDFGISIEEIGFPPYQDISDQKGPTLDSKPGDAMSLRDVYEEVFSIGMVAETGFFETKNEAYADFKAGGDMESAEMMLFDVIDETTHVQYAHRWLPVLAEKAGVDNSNYKQRSVDERARLQKESIAATEQARQQPPDPADPGYVFYQELLARIRVRKPLTNADTCPPRHHLPM